MLPEIGNFALCIALGVCLLQASLPLVGAARGNFAWISFAKPAARAQFLLVGVAYVCLTIAFIQNDFSVAYVVNNGNTATPLIYKISGVWGAHEGSLLLWMLMLSGWTAAVSVFSRSVSEVLIARVLAVMGMISIGFLLFMLLTSNPFDRIFPAPLEGRDLNPLLQDIGLAIHPPMLYMGYVGFSVAFAFAVAALIEGRLDGAWARWTRPWTNIAWSFLTIGIALGSWWAYYELGWGGWWFWDPVENASFMPWLVGTALVHSLAATEKRGVFKAWTVLLAVSAFSLSLLGTFLVRSGVLTSVHAFATDPTRGVFILAFLAVVIGGSLALYAWRAPRLRSVAPFDLVSRETALLINNVLLVVAAATVLLGTLYPLFIDILGMGKISVGPPYFNAVFVPLAAPLALLLGIGALLRWKRDQLARLDKSLVVLFVACIVAGTLLPLALGDWSLGAAAGCALGLWTIAATIAGLFERAAYGKRWNLLATAPRSFYGMTLAHFGIGVFVLGVTLASAYTLEKDIRMAPGDSHTLGQYTFSFDQLKQVQGPNYTAHDVTINVRKNGGDPIQLNAQKRVYVAQQNPMTEAGIDAGFTRDLYVSLGEPLDNGEAWSFRLHVKPFVRWIWMGCIFMMLGGFLAASDRRYQPSERQKAQAAVAAADPGAGATA